MKILKRRPGKGENKEGQLAEEREEGSMQKEGKPAGDLSREADLYCGEDGKGDLQHGDCLQLSRFETGLIPYRLTSWISC